MNEGKLINILKRYSLPDRKLNDWELKDMITDAAKKAKVKINLK